MKKTSAKSLLAVSLSGLLLLTATACSKTGGTANGETEPTKPASYNVLQASSEVSQASASSTSETSSGAEDTSSEKGKEEKVMDIAALANGDYSSIKGTWQDAAGQQLVFDDKGLVSDSYELYGASLTDYGTASAGVYGGETGGFLLEFIPKGVQIAAREGFQDNSDSSQDRLWTGVGLNTFAEQGQFYYRVSE